MANNRMFLIHKPSKIGISLGKRMGWGWYQAPETDELNKFYEYLSMNYSDQDDFILAMEDCESSGCFGDWDFTGKKENDFILFDFKTRK